MNELSKSAASKELERAVDSAVPAGRVLIGGDEYTQARAVWNGAVQTRPLAVVHCAGVAEVQGVVRAVRELGLRLTVRGGGHDWAGRALSEGGVVLDLRGMQGVEIDARQQLARVEGGAHAQHLLNAAAKHGLTAVLGNVGSVGVVGLTLGGGYSPLSGRYGLAADQVVAAQVVLADGTVVETDADHEPELFWALRGGGGNFGVVTALTLRLHPQPSIVSGMILYPVAQTASVLRGLREVLHDAPDDLTVQGAVLTGRSGDFMLNVTPIWTGSTQDGLREDGPVQRLARLGTPALAQLGESTVAADAAALAANYPVGLHVSMRSRLVAELTDDVVAVLVEQATAAPSPMASIAFRQFHGAAARIDDRATPFAPRVPHLGLEIAALWSPDASAPEDAGQSPADLARANHDWADETSAALAPHSLPGGYPNLLTPQARDQVAASFGPNQERLRAAKGRYDPEEFFTAIALP